MTPRTPKNSFDGIPVEQMICLRDNYKFKSISIQPYCPKCRRKDMVKYVKCLNNKKLAVSHMIA